MVYNINRYGVTIPVLFFHIIVNFGGENMAAIMEYNYDVEATFVYGSTNISISDNISTIITSFEYDNKNMPIIYLQLKASPDLYNSLVQHQSEGSIILNITKYDATSSSQIKKKYISDSFSYMMTTDPNYNASIATGSSNKYTPKSGESDASSSNTYFAGYLALLKEDSLNNNKQANNDTIVNSNLMSVIHKYTSHMDMVIEPIDATHNITIGQLIIPPIDTVTKLLSYLNSQYSFYSNGYRYFRDFNKTYLLSNSGAAVDLHDGTYTKILITICDPLEINETKGAMEIDAANKAYVIKVNANDISMKIDQSIDRNYNSIVAVDSSGNTSKMNLNVSSHSDSAKKVQFQKVSNSNFGSATDSKAMSESSGTMITITKANVDSSILTPNKEYVVKNYKDNSQYNGTYILSYKKEVITKDGNFIIAIMFGLRKAADS